MALQLREADLIRDESVLVGMAQTHLGVTEDRRFRWLYRDGPCGPARVWLGFNGSSQNPVGMAALFPRQGYIGGELVQGCVLGDFCVSEQYRSLGPALQLQRACMAKIQSGEFAFSYDFPSTSMLGIYRYMGIEPMDTSVRMVKLLSAEAQIRQRMPVPAIASALTKAADFGLTLKDQAFRRDDGMEYRLDDQPCASEYLELAQRIGSSQGNCIFRSPDYLNWRYRRHPYRKYEFLTCHRGGELQAYCIFSFEDGRAQIADLFGSCEDKIITGLLKRLVCLVRNRGKAAITVSLLASDPRVGALRKLGFHCRESSPVIGFGPKLPVKESKLVLMYGDRES